MKVKLPRWSFQTNGVFRFGHEKKREYYPRFSFAAYGSSAPEDGI